MMGAVSTLLVLLPLAAALLLVVAIWRTSAAPGPLSDVTRSGAEVVLTVHAPVWLAFRRRLAAPAASVASARVLPAGARERLRLRICGTGWPGMSLGWFLGGGWCFVVRRRRRDAVEITFREGRVRRWVVEATAPAEVVRGLAGTPEQGAGGPSVR
jgi:hypothetical protein